MSDPIAKRHVLGNYTTTVTFFSGAVSDALSSVDTPETTLLVADSNTAAFCRDYGGPQLTINAGETAKQWPAVASILEKALALGLSRDGRIVAVGGGVLCDVAAFAASIYMRGISLTLVPTTLLAMVDAAFGGKTGINFGGYKNMVGTFYPADRLLIVPSAVGTLPEREYKSGLAEVIKSAMLGDPNLFDFLLEAHGRVMVREPEAVRIMVERSLDVKASVVERDLTESGIRAWLNLGHTFAHALESIAGLGKYTHGEAVAWGVACALALGCELGLTSPTYAERAIALIERYGFAVHAEGVEASALFEAMKHDKKVKAGTIRFVVQRDLGDTLMLDAPAATVQSILSARVRPHR